MWKVLIKKWEENRKKLTRSAFSSTPGRMSLVRNISNISLWSKLLHILKPFVGVFKVPHLWTKSAFNSDKFQLHYYPQIVLYRLTSYIFLAKLCIQRTATKLRQLWSSGDTGFFEKIDRTLRQILGERKKKSVDTFLSIWESFRENTWSLRRS